ncbi:MAG TPA: hypothetical protein PK644_07545, partial [bacterium]|nr:hypothetical protein [bacterium]
MLKLGQGDLWLRLLPALAGLACLPTGWFLARKMLDEEGAFFFLLLLTFSPVHILWSQVLKSYSLFSLFGLASSILFLKCPGENKRSIFLLWLSDLLLLYLHHYSVFFILAQFLTLFLLRKLSRGWLVFFALLFLAWIPWLIYLPGQIAYTSAIIRRIPQWLRWPYFFFYTVLGETVSPFNLTVVVPAALFSLAGWWSGFWRWKNLVREQGVYLLLVALLPLVVIPFRSTLPQNLVPFTTFWYLMLAAGAKTNWKSTAAFCGVLICMIVSVSFYHAGVASQFHDISRLAPFREIGRFLTEQAGENDIIITNEDRKWVNGRPVSIFDRYYQGKAAVLAVRPEDGPIERLDQRVQPYKGVWLLQTYAGEEPWNMKLRQHFTGKFVLVEAREYLRNERWLERIKTGQRSYYYYLTLCHFTRKGR